MQGFNWESWKGGWYKKLTGEADWLAGFGITTIWLPPPTASVSAQGYMPTDLYNLNSSYGSQEELRRYASTSCLLHQVTMCHTYASIRINATGCQTIGAPALKARTGFMDMQTNYTRGPCG